MSVTAALGHRVGQDVRAHHLYINDAVCLNRRNGTNDLEGLLLKMMLEPPASLPESIQDDEFVGQVDPTLIDVHWAHARHQCAFSSVGYERLKESIFHCGRNEVPVLVHRNAASGRFVLVYGRCRLQSALELGLWVTSVVRTGHIGTDDQSTVRTMATESEWGTPWSLYERGTLLQRSLEKGLFASKRQAANFLGWTVTDVDKALQVAAWPKELIAAFKNPTDIKETWVGPLTRALQDRPETVFRVAEEVAGRAKFISSNTVYKALTAAIR